MKNIVAIDQLNGTITDILIASKYNDLTTIYKTIPLNDLINEIEQGQVYTVENGPRVKVVRNKEDNAYIRTEVDTDLTNNLDALLTIAVYMAPLLKTILSVGVTVTLDSPTA